jgi:hypothetical protein
MDWLRLAASIMYVLVVIVIFRRLRQIEKQLADIRETQLTDYGVKYGIEALSKEIGEES